MSTNVATAASTPVLKLDNVHAGYGLISAIKGISLEVHAGEIVTIIGANGAGKTTTLLCISGIHRIRQGSIWLKEEKLDAFAAHIIVALGVAQVPEGRKIFPRLTVRENLELGAYVREQGLGEKEARNTKDIKQEIAQDIERCCSLFPILAQRASQLGGTLSGGEQQMLAISRALMSRPKMLLLDEPSMGVAPLIVEKIFETLREINRQGVSLLLVEQNAHLALALADRGYVLETGRIVITDNAKKLLTNPRVQEAYLGE